MWIPFLATIFDYLQIVNFIIKIKNGINFSVSITNTMKSSLSNHRDIVLVSFYKVFLMEDFTSKIAFGDNLMTSNTLELF